jgi:uncharacterized DUF497 family protein
MCEWDEQKNIININKHGVSFDEAQKIFDDPNHLIYHDIKHSQSENRYFCLGIVNDGILTVRFVIRESRVRIIGAGYWRKGRKMYEEANRIY